MSQSLQKDKEAKLLGLADDLLGFYRGLWNHIDVDEAAVDSYGARLAELRSKIDNESPLVSKRVRPTWRSWPAKPSAMPP